MGLTTAISWCDSTFNPWHGCAHVSPGCSHCYAEAVVRRYQRSEDYWGRQGRRRLFGEAHWREPYLWNARAQKDGIRRRVFCASMADVFEPHPDVVNEREKLWNLIDQTPWLDWLLLTKRLQWVDVLVPQRWLEESWPANVWLGVSIENQARAEQRIPQLLGFPATIRFVSAEPLLGPVDLSPWLDADDYDGPRVDWVIAGGESGTSHRVMQLLWVEFIAAACKLGDVPLFVKQDSGPFPGKQGRIPDDLWALKQSPVRTTAAERAGRL